MSNNIPGLNTEESAWVVRFLQACSNGVEFTESAPSAKAADHIIEEMKELGY